MTSLKIAALAALIASAGAMAQTPDQTTSPSTTSTESTKSMPDFRSLDANRDGVVSKDEAGMNADLAAKFDALDTDKNGTLSSSEYAKAGHKDKNKSEGY